MKRARSRGDGFIEGKKRFQICFVATYENSIRAGHDYRPVAGQIEPETHRSPEIRGGRSPGSIGSKLTDGHRKVADRPAK
jgi:hypothetical protein